MKTARALILLPLLSLLALSLWAPVLAQTDTPPPPTATTAPTPTPAPTATALDPTIQVLAICASFEWEACLTGLRSTPLAGVILVLVLLVVGLFGWKLIEGIGNFVKKSGESLAEKVWRWVTGRADPTRYYLRELASEFGEPKYQPFSAADDSDMRKPTLERVFLSLHLTPDRIDDAEPGSGDRERKGSEPGEMLRQRDERLTIAQLLRRRKHHLALIGIAGSGKSTILHWVAWVGAMHAAGRRLGDDDARELAWALSGSNRPLWWFRVVGYLRRLRLPIGRPLFPLFVPLGEFLVYCQKPFDPIEPGRSLPNPLPLNADALLQFACYWFNHRHPARKRDITPEYLKGRLRQGGLVLLDGVDEVAESQREAVRQAIETFLGDDSLSLRSRVLLTSRPAGYRAERWAGSFARCEVRALTEPQRDQLIRNWFGAVYVSRGKAQAAAERLIDNLDTRADDRVREMATNPLLATIFAMLQHSRHELPNERALVYAEAVYALLSQIHRKDERSGQRIVKGDVDIWRSQLAEIAFELHQANVGEAGMIRGDLVARVCAHYPIEEHDARAKITDDLMDRMTKTATLLEETRPNHIGFRSHRSFEEFLAGHYLIRQYAPGRLDRVLGFVNKVARSDDRAQWEEPLRLAMGLLATQSTDELRNFLDEFHALTCRLEDDAPAHDWCAAVAALGLYDLPSVRPSLGRVAEKIVAKVVDVFSRPDAALDDRQIAELGLFLADTGDARLAEPILARVVANPPAVPRQAQRRALGLALSGLGDPRFKAAANGLLVPATVPIPGSAFQMGTSPAEVEALKAFEIEPWDDEKPNHPVEVSAFEIGRFPVTNAEYRCFAEGAKGYDNPDWWSPEGRAWREGRDTPDLSIYSKKVQKQVAEWLTRRPVGKRGQPMFWDDSQWNADNLPVVGVSWYEAEAYCTWLSATTGQNYRLPREAEWERAARGPAGTPWPWGPNWDAARCNSEESKLNATTPVGMYPHGASVWAGGAVEDLIGNVWEWCADWYDPKWYSQPEAMASDCAGPATGSARVVRGGSSFYFRRYCRAAFRDRNVPADFVNNLGFRVVRSPM